MAGSTRQSREHKKWMAARRAQYRLQAQFDYIDWTEDVLNPESEALNAGRVRLEIESNNQDAAESIIKVTVDSTESGETEDAPSID